MIQQFTHVELPMRLESLTFLTMSMCKVTPFPYSFPHFPKFYSFNPQILILTHQQQTAFGNIVGKEETARNEQFLFFPQCFLLNQKIVSSFVNIYDIISLFAAELQELKIGM